jgi:hypothetical protein
MSAAVTDYRATWNTATNTGTIAIKTEGSNRGKTIKINGAAEYLAVLILLQGEKTVFAKYPILDTSP